jgi:nitrite reductase/ring-hydroxylating ferredoxin subunit
VAEPLSRGIRSAYQLGGSAGEAAKNVLHGVWLRHPLHPVFTDVPIGAWTTGLVLDAVAARTDDDSMRQAADVAMAVGLAGAAAAAVTGLTDWSETDGHERRTGLVHGLLNIAATTLYAAALVLRRRGERTAGHSCALAGYGIALGAAWFGGDLVYDRRVGVTHAAIDAPDSFTAVADSTELPDDSMKRVRSGDLDLLLVRQHGRLCALAHSCSHLGGPLSEGTLKDGSVVCPWHGSEFALSDGHVINGPATQNQPCLTVRERGGRIEVKNPD